MLLREYIKIIYFGQIAFGYPTWAKLCYTKEKKTKILLENKLSNRIVDWRIIYNKIKSNVDLKQAAKKGNLNLVNILIEANFDPSIDNNYAIGVASQNGYLDVVNRLLEDNRVDPSAIHNYAIRMASENGHLDVVNKLLEDDRVDPSADDNSAIQWASESGHLNIVIDY